jgi:hypothetical protein
MNSEQKQILIYAATFTMIVAAVVAGNYIFYKWVAKKEQVSPKVIIE